jgi:undecaprenyl-diphosphatase
MTLIQAIILGIIQGLTEFLPVSSSGHLVIIQQIFGLKEPELVFDIMLHIGTLIAVFIVFRKDIADLIKGFFIGMLEVTKIKKIEPSNSKPEMNPYFKLSLFIIMATIPTGIIGLLFEDSFEKLFSSIYPASAMLFVTGTMLLITKKLSGGNKNESKMSIWDALIIGTAQGIAITPGISRSGTTIAFGLFRGLNRNLSARFSFLLSIPAIIGAAILKLKDAEISSYNEYSIIIAGMIVSAIVGYISLKLLIKIVLKGKLSYFAYYCYLAGVVGIIAGLLISN